jgi:hypothetical protein
MLDVLLAQTLLSRSPPGEIPTRTARLLRWHLVPGRLKAGSYAERHPPLVKIRLRAPWPLRISAVNPFYREN